MWRYDSGDSDQLPRPDTDTTILSSQLELSTNLREYLTEKAPNRAFSLLKPTGHLVIIDT